MLDVNIGGQGTELMWCTLDEHMMDIVDANS